MRRFILLFLLVFAVIFSMRAQVIDPVQWSFAINDLNDTEF